MGSNDNDGICSEIEDTDYVIKLHLGDLQRYRSEKFAVLSEEVESFVREKEAILVKHFARVLFCKSRIDTSKLTHAAIRRIEKISLLDDYLSAINVSESATQSILKGTRGKSFEDIVQSTDSQLLALIKNCDVDEQEGALFFSAIQKLRDYTKKWIADGKAPEDDSILVSGSPTKHEHPEPRPCSSRTSVSSPLDEPVPSVASVSGTELKPPSGGTAPAALMATAESEPQSLNDNDSGVGSNVSQNSLPTTTPPPSPGYLLHNVVDSELPATPSRQSSSQVLVSWSQHPQSILRCSSGPKQPVHKNSTGSTDSSHFFSPASIKSNTSPRGSTLSTSPSTPPPSCKWGVVTSLDPKVGTTGGLIRSRSEDAELPNRVNAQGYNLTTSRSAYVDIRSTDRPSTASQDAELLPNHLSPPVALKNQRKFQGPPSPGFAIKKPGATTRLGFDIPHKWERRRFKPTRYRNCYLCSQPLQPFTVCYKCTACHIRVHPDCMNTCGNTCGMSRELCRAYCQLKLASSPSPSSPFLPDRSGSFSHPHGRSGGDLSPISDTQLRKASDTAAMMRMHGQGTRLITYPHSSSYTQIPYESTDSSSSTPSTPAPGTYSPAHGTRAHSRLPKFRFPDSQVVHEVPDISVEAAESVTDTLKSIDSDKTFNGEPQDSDQTLSLDSQQEQPHEGPEGNRLKRDQWATIRGNPHSWEEWTIPIKDISNLKDNVIGKGHFGVVKRGYWHQDVAVKFLNMDHVAESNKLEAFKQEVWTFRNTRHDNVVLFLGCCLDQPDLGIVMNLCKGQPLYQHLHVRKDKFDLTRIVNVLKQICVGMSYLHGKKIVHKDLRTKNVFLELSGKVVITDFGLFSMQRLYHRPTSNVNRQSYLTVPEHWLCYLAPELIRNLKPFRDEIGSTSNELDFTFESDAYSFGTVYFEMLSGEFPFKRCEPELIVFQVGHGVKPPLNIQTSKEIKEILLSCWSFRPDDRPDFGSLSKSLEKLPKSKKLSRSPSHPVHMISRSAESVF